MKKKLFIVSLIAIFFVCIFSFTTINVNAQTKTSEEMVNEELNNINLPDKAIIDFPVPYISVYNSTIEWKSSNYDLLNVPQEGGWVKVTRPEVDTDVVLTVTITNGEYSKSKDFTITVLKGTTLTNTYNINYVLYDGTQNANNPVTYKVGTEVALHAPTKGRVEFLGWYLNPEFEGEAVTALPKATSGDVTLYAKWDKAVVERIEVVTQPTKVVYNALEQFDPTGIVVKAYYNDDLTEEVVEFEELEFDKTTLHGNDTKVVVSYGELTDEIEITVNKLNYDLTKYFKDTIVTYNGEYQTYTGTEPLPEGLVVEIQGGSTNATEGVEVNIIVKEYNDVDYNQPKNITVTLTVEKAKLIVKVNPAFANVGAAMPTFSASVEGLQGNDKLEDLGTLVFESEAKDTATEGKFNVTASGLESDNYEIEYQAGTFTITDGQFVIYVDPAELTKTYDGTTHTITAVVMSGEEQLDVDSIVYEYNQATFNGAVNAGEYVITIKFYDAQYGTGETAVTLKINKATYDLSGIKLNDKSVEYNGNIQGLIIEGTLPEGVEVSYTEGLKEVGSKKITATFTGDTTNHEAITLTLEATLTVVAKELTENMFEAIPNQSYTGSAITPTINGSFANSDLALGKDIEVSYENNIEQGTATVTVQGIGNFTGEVTLTFEIGESDLVKAEDAKEELEEKYSSQELPVEFVTETTNGAKVSWFSTSTALSVNAEGVITTIQTNEEQHVLVYALIVVNNSAEYTAFEYVIPALEDSGDVEETFPYENVDYNLVIDQLGLDPSQTLYLTGQMDGYYGEMSNNVVKAAIINVIKIEGGFNLYVKTTDQYINAELSGTHRNFVFGDSATTIWTYDEEHNALVTTLDGAKLFIGTYSTHDTCSLSDYDKYINNEENYKAYLKIAEVVSDADKLALDKEELTIETQATSNITLPTSGANGSDITWTTSNAAAITAEGVVTRGSEDVTVTLTATLTLGNSQDTKEFEVVVPKEVVVDPDQPSTSVEATITFDDTAKRTVLTTDQQVWVENGITVTGNKASSTTNVADYSKPARFYKSSELVISVNGTISSITFNCNSNSYASDLAESITNSTLDGKVVTITNVNSSEVTYVMGAQVRIDSIVVNYTSSGSNENPGESENPETPVEPTTSIISYQLDGGTNPTDAPTSYVEGEGLLSLPTPTKDGYTFLGWYVGETKYESISATQTGNLILTAKWEEETQEPDEPVEPGEEVEATITFDDTAKRTVLTTDQQVWEQNGIKLINNKSASTTAIADYAKPARFYANSEIVVEIAGIKQIVFDCSSGSYATALNNSIGTVSGATVTVSSDKVTVVFDTAVDSFTIAKLTAQVRIDSITVTYTN